MRALRFAMTMLIACALLPALACGRSERKTDEQLRAEIAALEKERAELRARVDALTANDPRLDGMPETSVRLGIPTSLAEDLILRLMTGFVDQVRLELRNLKVHRSGRVRRVVTLGDWDLRVVVNRVSARLKTGRPTVTFGGNRVGVALPVSIVSGTGLATVRFKWDGKNISGAVCGDQDVTRQVTGTVWPDRYPVAGELKLTATAEQILAEPIFPVITLRLRVKPSKASWKAMQKIIDDKTGVCGFVLDKVNLPGVLGRLLARGFKLRLPTERIKPVAIPVGINPSMDVRGQTVALRITVSDLAITTQTIWLGANVTVGGGAAATIPAAGPPAAKTGKAVLPRTTTLPKD